MVGHQHVRVKRRATWRQCFFQPVQEAVEICFGEKAGLAIVAAQDHVKGVAWLVDAGATWHRERLSLDNSSPTPLRPTPLCPLRDNGIAVRYPLKRTWY